jgi:hypothetical protein
VIVRKDRRLSRLRVHAIDDDVDMRMRLVIMRDHQRLVLVEPQRPQALARRLYHLLPRRRLIRRPGKAVAIDRLRQLASGPCRARGRLNLVLMHSGIGRWA